MRLAKLMGLSVGLFLISFELFAQAPKEFNVTGGGSYCAGGAGLPVGLDGSELGVTYTLNKNGVPQVPTVPGTGLPITFGNQLFGTYTVTGANLFGTTAMKGNAEIKEEPNLPVGVSIVASANPVCADASVTFTATPVNGGTTPVYQWYRNGSPVGTNSPIYTVTPSNNDQVYVVMTSSLTCTTGNPATSNTITMTVNTNLPVGVSIVASANPVCSGTSVTFTATPVNGGTTPVYQWYRNGSPVGTNSPTYTVTPSNNDQVYVVMTSSLTCTTGNPATSNTITMTVNPNLPVSVSITASENPVCNGTSVTFTATPVNGGTSPVYQWYRNGSPVGSNSPVFTYTPNNNDQIYVVLTSSLTCTSGNPATSNTIRMTVSNRLPVSVTITASANPVCAGTSVTFTATPVNGGTTPAYQWYRNGTAVGTNSPTYTYTPSNNDQVYVVMTSSLTCTSGNPATSNTITMTVNSNLPVSVTISASANPVCAGTSVTFTATPVNGGTTPVYQWYRNGTAVGTNSSTYTYAPSNNDQIYVVLTSSLTCTSGNPATSNIITMTVNPVPAATASNNGPVCTGTPLNLTGGPAGMASYAWTGPNSFTSNQQSPVVSTSATLAMAGTYTLTVTSSNGCQAVATTNVVVYTAPVANAGTGGNECDLNFTFNAVPSVGTGTWFKTAGPGNATYSPNANSPTATVTVTAYGSYIFTWTEVNGTC
ncbi:MAG: hypothetical protein HPY62_01990, partial [Bacteroidales bacterium]|nr:hypothetical protein [Bacteroidales bacterium]